MNISSELERWSSLAKFSLTRGGDDGNPDISWNQLGEIRYLIRGSSNGWLEIFSSDKLGPERLLLSGISEKVIESFCMAGLVTLKELQKNAFSSESNFD
jgi:hypothetical protein